MGTFVVGAILVIVVCLIVRSMIHEQKERKIPAVRRRL